MEYYGIIMQRVFVDDEIQISSIGVIDYIKFLQNMAFIFHI